MSKLASSITKSFSSMTPTIHYKQLASALLCCTENPDNTSAPKHPCDVGVLVPFGMNFSSGGLIGGSRLACHLTVAGCGCAAPLMAQ